MSDDEQPAKRTRFGGSNGSLEEPESKTPKEAPLQRLPVFNFEDQCNDCLTSIFAYMRDDKDHVFCLHAIENEVTPEICALDYENKKLKKKLRLLEEELRFVKTQLKEKEVLEGKLRSLENEVLKVEEQNQFCRRSNSVATPLSEPYRLCIEPSDEESDEGSDTEKWATTQ